MKDKLDILAPFLRSRKAGGAIIYVTSQQDAEDASAALKSRGIDCKFYHAGVPSEERKLIQTWFMTGQGKNSAVVATIA